MIAYLSILFTTMFLTGATPTPPGLSDIVQGGLIDTLKEIYIQITQLFTVFPVNVFLTLTIISMAIALISKVVSSFRAAN